MGIEDQIEAERRRRDALGSQRDEQTRAIALAAAEARRSLSYFASAAGELEMPRPIVAFTTRSGFFGTKYEARTIGTGWLVDLTQFTARVPDVLGRALPCAVTREAEVVGRILPSSAFHGEDPYSQVQRDAPNPSLILVNGPPILFLDDPLGYDKPTATKAMGRIAHGDDSDLDSVLSDASLAQRQRGFIEWGGARHPVVPLEHVLANWLVDRSRNPR